MPDTKEIGFFSDYFRDTFSNGLNWYQQYFSSCRDQVQAGEITPEYLFDEEVPSRIISTLGEIHIIAVLRDPVARAYSCFCHHLREGRYHGTFSRFLSENFDHAIDRGMYHEQLMRYYELFGRDNLKVSIYEDIANDPVGFIQDIYEFLGVDATFIPPQANQKYNLGVSRTSGLFRSLKWLRDLVDRYPISAGFVRKAERTRLGNWAMRKVSESNRDDIPPREREYLREVYQEETEKLSELLGRDLGKVWK